MVNDSNGKPVVTNMIYIGWGVGVPGARIDFARHSRLLKLAADVTMDFRRNFYGKGGSRTIPNHDVSS